VLTPTGYRCKECIGSQQRIFDTALWHDLLLGFALAALLSFIGSLVITLLPLAILTILISPIIGTLIGEAVRRVTQKRRSRRLFLGVVAAIVAGALPVFVFQLIRLGFFTYAGGTGGFTYGLLPLVWQGVYLFLAASSAYYRLSGISIRM
jgi:hypothetical protein